MTKYYPDDASIERHGLAFLDRTLPKADWTHAGHFAAVLWLLRHRPDLVLVEHMPGFIRAYNEATGVPNSDQRGYHETITFASIRAARRFLASHPATTPLHEIVDALMATPLGHKDWLLVHWSRDLIYSVDARRGWVEPDLQPFTDEKG